MLHIVMDSGGDLPPEWIEEYQISVVPINVHLGDDVYLEGVNLTSEKFYGWVKESGQVPKTSQPTPQQYIEIYKSIAEPGDVILSIHLTSKLSGTYQSSVMAAQQLAEEGYQVIPFDTLAGTGIQGYMCREARVMERAGADLDQILKRLEEIRKGTEIIFTVDSLEFAQKSGRVQMLESILASILQIKPVITLKEGTLAVANKVRTRKASLDFIIQEMAERMNGKLINAAIIHAQDLTTALHISERIKGLLNIKDFFIEELSVGIATHLGPGSIGIVAYPVEEGVS
jgi:DegV family protein with EDD domain